LGSSDPQKKKKKKKGGREGPPGGKGENKQGPSENQKGESWRGKKSITGIGVDGGRKEDGGGKGGELTCEREEKRGSRGG